MNKKEFSEMVKKPVLLDGATGSCLLAAGMPRNVCTEQWILDHRDVLRQLQSDYVEAGSRILYAPTFGANRIHLKRFGLDQDLVRINTSLVELSRKAADGRAFVAGDVTTTGEMLEPFGDFTFEDAVEVYREQIGCLSEAGVDMIIAETMISIDETLAAIQAAHEVCSLPILCSVTVSAEGRLFTGGTAASAAAAFAEAGADAVGVNCSVGPDQLYEVVRSISEAVTLPVIVKPNAGLPVTDAMGNAVYKMEPEVFASHMKKLAPMASLMGGCCGTTPAFIQALAKIL